MSANNEEIDIESIYYLYTGDWYYLISPNNYGINNCINTIFIGVDGRLRSHFPVYEGGVQV